MSPKSFPKNLETHDFGENFSEDYMKTYNISLIFKAKMAIIREKYIRNFDSIATL